jgi:hypothetical protein
MIKAFCQITLFNFSEKIGHIKKEIVACCNLQWLTVFRLCESNGITTVAFGKVPL